MIVVLMGVSGTGKSTIGKALAADLGWEFVEGDDFHPDANVEKMRRDEPLTDEDRAPWLAALRRRINAAVAAHENIVLACSALKRAYRETLAGGLEDAVKFVYLHATREQLHERLIEREGHFADEDLLASQFATLEEPTPAEALWVEVTDGSAVAIARVHRELGV